MEKHTTESGLP